MLVIFSWIPEGDQGEKFDRKRLFKKRSETYIRQLRFLH